MANLSNERKAELKALIAKTPKLSAEKLAIKYGISTMQVAGIRRSITCDKLKASKQIAEFKANEKKEKQKIASENNGVFGNYNGVNKNHVRDGIVTKIVSSKPDGKILTLCADECKIERLIENAETNRFTYFGVELDKEVYKRLQNNLPSYPIQMDTYNGKLGDILSRTKENDFAHIVMDYCGQLSTFADDIITAVQNNLVVVGGSIFITLNVRASRHHLDFYNNILGLSSDTKQDIEKNKFVLSVVDSFLKRLCGFNYSFEKPYQYRDLKENGNLGANMVLLTITRLK